MKMMLTLKNKLSFNFTFNILIILASAITLIYLQNDYLKKIKHLDQELSKTEVEKAVKLEETKLKILNNFPTFGFNNLYADWIFLNFAQYFGDDPARKLSNYDLAPEYFEIILDRDPKFLEAYFYLSASSSIYAGKPERSVAIMNDKLKLLNPKVPLGAYYIWRYKAVDELLFLGDSKNGKESFKKASEWAGLYTDQESQSLSKIFAKTAEFLENNPDSKMAQFSAWLMVLNGAYDEQTRQKAITAIENIGGKVMLTPEGAIESIIPPEKD